MPTQFKTLAEFIAALTPEQRQEVEAVRDMVQCAHPELIESIKWNSPNWSLEGTDLLTVNVSRAGAVRLILHRGATNAENASATSSFSGDRGGLLKWHSDIRASLELPADVAREEVVAVIRAWVDAR